MDHSINLEADCVINSHLKDIEDLILEPSPEGLGLSSRYIFNSITLQGTTYVLNLWFAISYAFIQFDMFTY